MTEYSREAELLARALGLEDLGVVGWVTIAQRAIDAGWVQRDDLIAQGWTPPPDPYEDIARELWNAIDREYEGWFPTKFTDQGDLLAAVRRIPDDLARQVAEALKGDQ